MACYTRQEAKDLWDYAKETYLKQPGPHGYMDFKELTNRLSDDIFKATNGQKRIVPEEIAKLLATPKTIRNQRKTLLLTDRNRRAVLSQAKTFVEGTEKSPLNRFIKTAYETPYTLKVLGHGPALHMTHAWPLAFDPTRWVNFGKTWVNAWKAMKPEHAQAIKESVMLNPNFELQVRSGLAVDPRAVYDDVNQRANFWGHLGRMTSNSFLGLKQLRQMEWDKLWDTAPDHLKTDELAQRLSVYVNHMTGAPGPEMARRMSGRAGETLRALTFAPSLDVARVMRPVDLVQSLGIEGRHLLNRAPVIGEQLRRMWSESSPEARFVARENMKQWTRIAGTYAAVLYTSHLMHKYFWGDKHDINIRNVLAPDWGLPKGPNGRVWQATGGEIPMIRAVASSIKNPKDAGRILGNYGLNKLNPALSLGKGAYTGTGFGKEELPGFNVGPYRVGGYKEGTVGNWATYLTAELGPIATEDGIKEFSKLMSEQNGVPGPFNSDFLNATYKAGLVTIPSLLGTHSYQPEAPAKATKRDVNAAIRSSL